MWSSITVVVLAYLGLHDVADAAPSFSITNTPVTAGDASTIVFVCTDDDGGAAHVQIKKGDAVVNTYVVADETDTKTGDFADKTVATAKAAAVFTTTVTKVVYGDQATYKCAVSTDGTTYTDSADTEDLVVNVPLTNDDITLAITTKNTDFKCSTTSIKPKVDKIEWTFNGDAKTGGAKTDDCPTTGDTAYCSSQSTLTLTEAEAEADGDHKVTCTVTQGLVGGAGGTKIQVGDGVKSVEFSGGSAPAITLGMLALTLLLTLSQL